MTASGGGGPRRDRGLRPDAVDSTVTEELSAGAVVFHRLAGEPRYLLLHYPGGHWDFPKGHVEPGETLEEAALREVREETGLEVRLLSGFREEVKYTYWRGVRVRKRVVFFLAEAGTDAVRLSWEHVGYLWLPFSRALARLTYEGSRTVLAKAHRLLREAGGLSGSPR